LSLPGTASTLGPVGKGAAHAAGSKQSGNNQALRIMTNSLQRYTVFGNVSTRPAV
jgi:hypothetical protein